MIALKDKQYRPKTTKTVIACAETKKVLHLKSTKHLDHECERASKYMRNCKSQICRQCKNSK